MPDRSVPRQSAEAIRAEVNYRQAAGATLAADTAAVEHHRRQLLAMLSDFGGLVARDVSLGPFLELGAGRAYRSGAAITHWPVAGVASDISLGWLRDAPVLAGVFGQSRLPDRVCCDAADLPFLDDTFAFVFAYRTLHHFPDPAPVVTEAHRVLAGGGSFYFNHEPVDSRLRRLLRANRVVSEPPSRAQRLAVRVGAQKVFWDDGGPERMAGILEERFCLSRWQEALAPFEHVTAYVNRRLGLQVGNGGSRLGKRIAGIVGGNLEALCLKSGHKADLGHWSARLRCLDCGFSPLAVHDRDGSARCAGCGRAYPCVDGVLVLLRAELQEQLYPELVHQDTT